MTKISVKFYEMCNAVKDWQLKQWAISYAIVAMLTFGWAGHHNRAIQLQERAEKEVACSTEDQRTAHFQSCYSIDFDHSMDDVKSVFEGIFWPLYWVRAAFDIIPSTPHVVTVEKVVTKEVYVPAPDNSTDASYESSSSADSSSN